MRPVSSSWANCSTPRVIVLELVRVEGSELTVHNLDLEAHLRIPHQVAVPLSVVGDGQGRHAPHPRAGAVDGEEHKGRLAPGTSQGSLVCAGAKPHLATRRLTITARKRVPGTMNRSRAFFWFQQQTTVRGAGYGASEQLLLSWTPVSTRLRAVRER